MSNEHSYTRTELIDIDMVVEAQPLLNDLLKDDSLANGYVSYTRTLKDRV